jgi:predicted permease
VQRAVDSFLLDARYALRGLRRNPVLCGSVVLTLIFGIGLNAGAFAVVTGMVFRPRIEKDPASFFQVLGPDGNLFRSSQREFETDREKARTVTNLSVWAPFGVRINGDTRATLIQMVSCGFFELYGLDQAKLGRLLQEYDCVSTASPVAVLGEEIWRDRFHSDPGVIGSPIAIGNRPVTVVGVAAAGFPGRLRGPGIWAPYTARRLFSGERDESGLPWLTMEGRLAPGYSRADAAAEFSRFGKPGVMLTNGALIQMPAARQAAVFAAPLFMGALTLLLILACTNVTVLLLSRAAARRYEMGVRLALGAGRARLLRMAATEGVLLALIAGAAAVFVAGAVPAAIPKLVPGMPHYPMKVDWVVFAYLAGITLAAGCAAGMAPAAESLRGELSGSLKREQTVVTAGRSRWKLRDLLIAAQVTISLVLLVGAALFARAEFRILAQGRGDDARHSIVVPLPRGAWDAVAARVRMLPGVRAVELSARGELVARFEGDSARIKSEVRETLRALGVEPRDLPETLDTLTAEMAGRFRSVAVVALFLGCSALVLAVIGVYGVIAFAVQQRTKEIGIRLALGATRADILNAVFAGAARPVLAGVICGLPLAIGGAAMLDQALRRSPAPLDATDPAVFAAVSLAVVAAAGAAMLRPALRASGWDPMVSLRNE